MTMTQIECHISNVQNVLIQSEETGVLAATGFESAGTRDLKHFGEHKLHASIFDSERMRKGIKKTSKISAKD